jgi:hypothetical protein
MDLFGSTPNYVGGGARSSVGESNFVDSFIGRDTSYRGPSGLPQPRGEGGPKVVELASPAIANATTRVKVPVSVDVPKGARLYLALVGGAYLGAGAAEGAELKAMLIGTDEAPFGQVPQGAQKLTLTATWSLAPGVKEAPAGANKAPVVVLFI